MNTKVAVEGESHSLFCKGLCGTPNCDCEFSEELDFYMHTNKDDPDSLTVSDSMFCRRCMHLFSAGEIVAKHSCKPLYQIEQTVPMSNQSKLISNNYISHRDESSSSSGDQSVITLESENDSVVNEPIEAIGASPAPCEVTSSAQGTGGQEIVGIFWDIENIFIPDDKSPAGVVRVLRELFVFNKREVEFQCVCDTHKEERFIIDQLNSSLVTVVHVTCTDKNAADEKLKQLLVKFSQTYQAPATVVLLSGDVNFSPTLNSLKNFHKFHVVLVHNKQCSQALKETASELHLIDDLIVGVLPPEKRSFIHSSFIVVSGLPVWLINGKQMRTELAKLCDNTGGRVVNIEGDRALIRFQQPENAARCQRRLNNLSLLGVNITARLTADRPFGTAVIRPIFCETGNRFPRPLANKGPRVVVHTSYPHPHALKHRYPQSREEPFKYWLKFYPIINSSSFEVITRQHIETCLKSLGDILIVESTLPLIDSIAVCVQTSLEAELLIETIRQRKFSMEKIQLFNGNIQNLYFQNFIADAYLVLSLSKSGWMFVRDFNKGYNELKKHICHKDYLDRILSTSSRIVCGFRDQDSYDLSILANEDCNPLLNFYFPSDLSELDLRLKVNQLLRLPQFSGKMHYFDLLPTFRSTYGNQYFKLYSGGANVMSILNKLPDISILHESKTGVCRNYLRLVRSKPTPKEMNGFNEEIIMHILIEKSNSIPFELLRELCSNYFHLKLSSSSNGLEEYGEILNAIEGFISQLTVAPKIRCKFADTILCVKQHIWELVCYSGSSGMPLELLEKNYYQKTGQKIPIRPLGSSTDLLACIPGLKVFRKHGKIFVCFIENYVPELHASQCVRLINAVPSQNFSNIEFRSQYQQSFENPINFPLETIPQIYIHCRDNTVSRIHMSLRYLAIEICHFLYQQPNYSISLQDFNARFLFYYNKPLIPSTFGFQSNIELFNRLEDYIFIERESLCLLKHRVFACEVCQVFRKLTNPNESILLSNFHGSFLRIHYKDLKLANYNAAKLTPLLLKVSDVIEISEIRDEDRLLTLTSLGRFVPEPSYPSKAKSVDNHHPRKADRGIRIDNTTVRSLILKCENLIYTQPNHSCQISEFEKLYKVNYNESISIQDHSFRNFVHFISSYSEFFCILGSGPASSISLQPERVFVGECRLLFQIHTNGINVSNLAQEYPSISNGKEFDLARYGSYSKLSKLIYEVKDALSLLGPSSNWLVSNEQSTELIECDKQVDLLCLSNIIDSALIDNGGTPLAFDEIPFLYKRLHQCEAPKWISVLITCPPLMKMYAEQLVSICGEFHKTMKDKRVYFQLSSAKWEVLFKDNATCLFYRRNKLRLPIQEFISSYQADYCDIDIALLGYEKMEHLLNSRYLQMIEENNINYVCLSAEGLQVLFQKQIVEILFYSEEYSVMVDSITSKYYNTYGYNLKLKEMDISKLIQLLSLQEISSLVSISGDRKEKCLSLKNEIIQREKCRQVLTELSIEIKFPFKYELFSERYYTKFKEKCDIQLVYDSASQVVRVLGQNGCYKITSAIYSYPHRKLSSIPKGNLLTPEHLVNNPGISSKNNSNHKEDTSINEECVPNYDDKTTTESRLIYLEHKNPKAPTSPSHSKNSCSISSVRILKRPKDYFDNKEKSHSSHPVTYKEAVCADTEDSDNNYSCDTASFPKKSLNENVLATTPNISTLSLTVFPTNTESRLEKQSLESDTSAESSIPKDNSLNLCVKDEISTDEAIGTKSINSYNKNSDIVGKSTSGFGEPDKPQAKGRISLAANFSFLDHDD